MFEEQIALVRRASLWQETIERTLQSSFGPDTFARYRMAWDLYKDELDRDIGDESTRAINAWNRIVTFLGELDSRAAVRT